MKVLFLSSWYPSRVDPQNGVFVRKHAQAVARFHDVTVFHAQPAEKQWETEVHKSNNFTEIVSYYPSSNKLSNALKFLKQYKHLESNAGININDFDVVHANILTRAGYIAQQYKKDHDIPYILTEHWSGFVSGLYDELPGWQKTINKSVVKDASAITCVSHHLQKEMQHRLPHDNYNVIPNSVELAVQSSNDIRNGLLMVCDLEDDKKNVSGVLEVVATLPNIPLNIIGDGSDSETLQKKAEALNISNRVSFLGRMTNNEVLQHYSKASAVVINSNVETFSVVTLEAIAANTPLIATRCGGPEEIAKDSNAIFIEKNDPSGLSKAIQRIIEDPSKFTHSNREAILTQYSPSSIGQQFSELYKSVVN